MFVPRRLFCCVSSINSTCSPGKKKKSRFCSRKGVFSIIKERAHFPPWSIPSMRSQNFHTSRTPEGLLRRKKLTILSITMGGIASTSPFLPSQNCSKNTQLHPSSCSRSSVWRYGAWMNTGTIPFLHSSC